MGLKTALNVYFLEYKNTELLEKFLRTFESQNEHLNGIDIIQFDFLQMNVFDTSLLQRAKQQLEKEPQTEIFPELEEAMKLKKPRTKEQLVNDFLVNKDGLKWFMKSSVSFYHDHGHITGAFKKAIEDMMDAYKLGK